MTTPVPDPAIIAAYQELSQTLAGPTPPGSGSHPIPTRPQPTITDVQPPQAAAGTPVIITGTNLGGTISVSVGTTTVSHSGVTATEVTFDPSGPPTTAKILVLTTHGGVLSPGDFEVL